MANRDNAVMGSLTPRIDVWERANYLKYQNRRAELCYELVEGGELGGSWEEAGVVLIGGR